MMIRAICRQVSEARSTQRFDVATRDGRRVSRVPTNVPPTTPRVCTNALIIIKMKNLGMSSFLVAGVLLLLLVCVVLMAYVMYTLSSAKEFELEEVGTGTTKYTKVKTAGIEAKKFWADKKLLMITPTVGNVLAMVMLGLMYAMG